MKGKLVFGGILLNLIYLIVLPNGLAGFLILLCGGFALVLLGTGMSVAGVFFLLYGQRVLGMIFHVAGFPGIGAPISILIGLIIILPWFRRWGGGGNWSRPLSWILVCSSVIFVAFLYGPQSEYSRDKMFLFYGGLLISTIALMPVFRDKDFNVRGLGVLFLSGGAVILGSYFFMFPFIRPENMLIPGSLRLSLDRVYGETDVSTISFTLLAAIGIVLVLGNIRQMRESRFSRMAIYLSLVIGGIVLFSSGRRQAVIGIIISMLPILFERGMKKKKRVLVFATILVSGLAIFYAGYVMENPYFSILLDRNESLLEKFNRGINWDAALTRICEKPWFGHGLGGYYIEELSFPGGGTYAHNLFLELLSETGVIGTFLVVIPLLLFFIFPEIKRIISFRTMANGNILPFLILLFVLFMISSDLSESYMLFAVWVALWVHIRIPSSSKGCDE